MPPHHPVGAIVENDIIRKTGTTVVVVVGGVAQWSAAFVA